MGIVCGCVHRAVGIPGDLRNEAGHILYSLIASFQILQLGAGTLGQLKGHIHTMLSGTVRLLGTGGQLLG
ncbi:hypothetical protein D3C81_2133230 [compost metagenome]